MGYNETDNGANALLGATRAKWFCVVSRHMLIYCYPGEIVGYVIAGLPFNMGGTGGFPLENMHLRPKVGLTRRCRYLQVLSYRV